MKPSRRFVPQNTEAEAFELFSELLMPSIQDVRGESILFDLGGFTHLQRRPDRLVYIRWIRETLQNPAEIRQDRERDHREIYVAAILETEASEFGTPFVVVVDRRIQLTFWTAFSPTASYLSKIRNGKLLWQRQRN
ncbi:MAG: PBECR2 nuclease fold domain-containing protein [Anaerolineae bacterium]